MEQSKNSTVNTLFLDRPVSELPAPEREALSGWLLAHEIDPDQVAPGSAVELDEYLGRITWQTAVAGRARMTHMRYYPSALPHGPLPELPSLGR